MLITSFEFWLIFPVLIVIFALVKGKYRSALLGLISILLLGYISLKFTIYAIIFTLINFFIGIFIADKNKANNKLVYFVGQIFNIGSLFLYKYLDFVINSINTNILVGSGYEIPELKWFIPLGISYYTFQGISYLYLIYKVNDRPERNIFNFTLYMLFFPKFVAGPIERHRLFLPQLKNNLEFKLVNLVEGGKLILWGLVKKIIVADTLGLILNKVYGNIDKFEGVPLLIVFILQPIRLYFDFSGYTDMAIGIAKCFGLKLSENFNRPFFAKTVGEFWRRWHMSLSLWCNDFIFNRLLLKYRKQGNKAFVYAVFLSFFIIGIWHGAKWTFVILGILQGIALTYEFYTKKWRQKLILTMPKSISAIVSRSLVYLFVCFFLIFFYANNTGDAWYFITHLFKINNFQTTTFGFNVSKIEFAISVMMAIIFLFIEWKIECKKFSIEKFGRVPVVLRWSLYYMAVFAIVYFSKNQNVFVYGQF